MEASGCWVQSYLTFYNESGGRNTMWNIKLLDRALLQVDIMHCGFQTDKCQEEELRGEFLWDKCKMMPLEILASRSQPSSQNDLVKMWIRQYHLAALSSPVATQVLQNKFWYLEHCL